MSRYIFGECNEQPFYLKKDEDDRWETSLEDFPLDEFSESTTRELAIGKLLEHYQGNVEIFSLKLSEAKSTGEVLELLRTKLGSLSEGSNGNVEDLLDDGDKLTKKAQNALEKITSKKAETRILKTKYLSKAWSTIKGTNAAIRNLAVKQPAYLFVFLKDGTIVEGASKLSQYKLNLSKDVTEEKINKQIKMAVRNIDNLCNAAVYNLTDDGKAVIATFKKDSNANEATKVQKAFRDAFTKLEDAEKKDDSKGLVKLVMKKAMDSFKNAFSHEKEIKVADLKKYQFISTIKIEMPYTTEEVNIAREALLVLGKPKAQKKPSSKTASKSKGASTSATPKLPKGATSKLAVQSQSASATTDTATADSSTTGDVESLLKLSPEDLADFAKKVMDNDQLRKAIVHASKERTAKLKDEREQEKQ